MFLTEWDMEKTLELERRDSEIRGKLGFFTNDPSKSPLDRGDLLLAPSPDKGKAGKGSIPTKAKLKPYVCQEELSTMAVQPT